MWRGVGPALARISLGSSVYFTTQTQLLDIIRSQMREEGLPPDAPLSFNTLTIVGFVSRSAARCMDVSANMTVAIDHPLAVLTGVSFILPPLPA
jgi:hypothetical protein